MIREKAKLCGRENCYGGELVIIESILTAELTALKHSTNIGLLIDKALFISQSHTKQSQRPTERLCVPRDFAYLCGTNLNFQRALR